MTVISIMPINVSAEDSLNVIEIQIGRETGHVRGYVQGEIDADIQGTFQGQMKVSVDSVIPGRQGQIEQNDLDSQQISEDDDIADNKAQEGDEES